MAPSRSLKLMAERIRLVIYRFTKYVRILILDLRTKSLSHRQVIFRPQDALL